MSLPTLLKYDYVKNKIEESGEYVLISKEYVYSQKKLEIKHLDCGKIYETTYSNFRDGSGRCPVCFAQRFTLEFCQSIAEKSGYEILSNEYLTARKKLEFRHVTCGTVFNSTWDSFNNKKGSISCPKCSKEKIKSERKHTLTVISKNGSLEDNRPDLASEWSLKNETIPSEHAENSNEKIWWVCPNGHEDYSSSISNRNRGGCGCPKCSPALKYTIEKVREFVESQGHILISRKYINCKEKLKVRCPECKEIFLISFDNFRRGKRCPHCSISKGAKKVEEELISLGFKKKRDFVREKAFDDCFYKKRLRFDFYLPKYNLLIEYQGEQHYFPVKFGGKSDLESKKRFQENLIRDNLKIEYSKTKNIKLLIIPYWEKKNIRKILSTELNLDKN